MKTTEEAFDLLASCVDSFLDTALFRDALAAIQNEAFEAGRVAGLEEAVAIVTTDFLNPA